jgi:hypothetical protein
MFIKSAQSRTVQQMCINSCNTKIIKIHLVIFMAVSGVWTAGD